MTAKAFDFNLLSWLACNEDATASEVGLALGITLPSARCRLRHLDRQKLVTGNPNDAVPSHRIYAVIDEGQRKAGLSDAWSMTG